MRDDLIVLHFRAPMRGASAEPGRVPSDLLWSALYAADARLQGGPLDVSAPYRVTSALPYGGAPLLPKPRVSPTGEAPNGTDKKTAKRLRFVTLPHFLKLARGEHLSASALRDALAEQERALRPRLLGEVARDAEARLRAALRATRKAASPTDFARATLGIDLAAATEPEVQLLLAAARGRPTSGSAARQRNTQDRVTGATDTFLTPEVAQPRLWFVLRTTDDAQRARLLAALRLLADTGLGGLRTHGSGTFAFEIRAVPADLADGLKREWPRAVLLSLAQPTPEEAARLDTSDDAQYTLVRRDGFIDGTPERRRETWMLGEGSLVPAPLGGRVLDVRPDGFPHPVWRSGLALAVGVDA